MYLAIFSIWSILLVCLPCWHIVFLYLPYSPYPICLPTIFRFYYPAILPTCPILYGYLPYTGCLSDLFALFYLSTYQYVLYYLSIYPTCPILSVYLPYTLFTAFAYLLAAHFLLIIQGACWLFCYPLAVFAY